MFFIRPFTDPVIVLSTCLCCYCFFVVFLSWSKSVCFYTSIHWPCYCTVYMFMLSLFFFVVFLSWSKSVCFLYNHSLTLLLYCLHVYAVIVFLWSFWVGVNLYVFIQPFTDPVIVLSTCLCCHCFFVVFLSGSKSVCFLYNHSLTLLLYCLHVYVVIVFL